MKTSHIARLYVLVIFNKKKKDRKNADETNESEIFLIFFFIIYLSEKFLWMNKLEENIKKS